MTPVSYKIRGDTTTFIYNSDELKEWINRGNEHGDCGMLLISRTGKMSKYAMYGTIENPSVNRQYLSIMHNEIFDGKFLTNDEIVNRKHKTIFNAEDYKLIFLDFSKDE